MTGLRDELRQDVREVCGQLRLSWAWLVLLAEPGPATRPPRPGMDDRRAAVLEARGHSDRTYRLLALRDGRGALAPSPAPVCLEITDAQEVVRAAVIHAAGRVADWLLVCYVGDRAGQVAAVVDVLDWLDGGDGSRWLPGVHRWVAGPGGIYRRGVVDDVTALEVLVRLRDDLAEADAAARAAAGVTAQPVQEVPLRCPACARRSLQLNHDGPDRRRWYVECVSQRCLCRGAACGCLQPDRREGRRHSWSVGELGGPYGLRTAVAVRGTLREHTLAAQGRTSTLHTGVVGHGGWSSRRTGS